MDDRQKPQNIPESGVNAQPEVLVIPRTLFASHARFRQIQDAPDWNQVANRCAWLPRDVAEHSDEWVQPIPSAVLKNREGEYLTLRRIRDTRADLKGRLSLLVGGHVEPTTETHLTDLLLTTLRRELEEELAVTGIDRVAPIGWIVDTKSLAASRHSALVYEITVSARPIPRAPEEFSTRSRFTGQFFSAFRLSELRQYLDPWSLILFEDFIAPGHGLRLESQQHLPFNSGR